MQPLNPLGTSLQRQIIAAQTARRARLKTEELAQKTHIVGAGQTLTAAYEQLRNAAENAEEHVLLQRAIGRFYRRQFLSRDENVLANSGEELAIELTHAGYVPNDSIGEQTIDYINMTARRYFHTYEVLRQSSFARRAEAWTLNVLAAEIEGVLQPEEANRVFVQFCHEYFMQQIRDGAVFDGVLPADTELALYVAIHLALMKSDTAQIRLGVLTRFQVEPTSEQFIATNQKIDDLLTSETTKTLAHYVDRHGASLRVLEHMITTRDDVAELLENEAKFIEIYEKETITEYERVAQKVNNGVIRSVIFLVITKFLLGIAIEVPYDRLVIGHIAWVPLLVNLLFPPAYMVLLRLTMRSPGRANTDRLIRQIEQMLYRPVAARQLQRKRRQTTQFGMAYDIVYAAGFLIVFGGVALGLWLGLGFSALHLVIFFVFLSAASFLGFRLSRMIRELEAIETYQSGITAARDFFYMPFVIAGRWISDKYSRFNLITMILDMLIELPLKTVLRLVRQWTAFISSKQDKL